MVVASIAMGLVVLPVSIVHISISVD
jgi:hypothetical protein